MNLSQDGMRYVAYWIDVGKCGLMLQFYIVKSKDMSKDDGEDFDHGTKILLGHIKPWWNMMKHVICADSYFSHI